MGGADERGARGPGGGADRCAPEHAGGADDESAGLPASGEGVVAGRRLRGSDPAPAGREWAPLADSGPRTSGGTDICLFAYTPTLTPKLVHKPISRAWHEAKRESPTDAPGSQTDAESGFATDVRPVPLALYLRASGTDGCRAFRRHAAWQ